jgi:hypothetical protein
MKSKQKLLFDYRENTRFISRSEFGGSLLKKSHAKSARPLSRKNSVHLVFRARYSRFLQKSIRLKIHQVLVRNAGIFSIRIKGVRYNRDNLQLIIYGKNRQQLQNFLRAVSGIISRIVLKREKGRPGKIGLWLSRPFSRILIVRKIKVVFNQTQQSLIAAIGIISANTS